MKRATVALALAGLGASATAGAEATAPAAIARGRLKAESEGCFECHLPDRPPAPAGLGPDASWPRLVAQPADYLRKQLRDFASGARKHDVMAIMARSLSEADRLDITAYFAAEAPRELPPPEGDARGRQLVEAGDASRGIAACASCHGAQGAGGPGAQPGAPRLLGQDARYLATQLRAWRSGERRNSVDGVMNRAAQTLNDDDIAALATHLGTR